MQLALTGPFKNEEIETYLTCIVSKWQSEVSNPSFSDPRGLFMRLVVRLLPQFLLYWFIFMRGSQL